MKAIFGIGLASLLSLSAAAGDALAHDPSVENPARCFCKQPVASGARELGRLIDGQGRVLLSTIIGYRPADQGASLTDRSRIIVGAQSKARLRIGDVCTYDLHANLEARLSLVDGQTCLRVSSLNPRPIRSGITLQDAEIAGPLLGAVIGPGVGLGVGLAVDSVSE